MAKPGGSAMGGAKAKSAGKRPATKTGSRKPAARKAVAAKLAVKAKVPKAKAKSLIDEFQGNDVYVEPDYGTTGATLTMLRVSPTRVGDD